MSRTLVRGQRLKLSEFNLNELDIRLTLQGPRHVQLFALVLGADGQAVAADALVSPNNARALEVLQCSAPSSPHEASGQDHAHTVKFSIEPAKLLDTQRILVMLGFSDEDLENTQAIQKGTLSLERASGEEVARFAFHAEDLELAKSLVLLEMYFKDGWRAFVNASGFATDIGKVLEGWGFSPHIIRPNRHTPVTNTSTDTPRMENPSHTPSTSANLGPELQLPNSWPGKINPRIPSQLIHAVGLVVVQDHNNQGSTGTGFAITPGGHVLTCYHVIEDARSVFFRPEGSDELRPARVLVSDEFHDIALLWLEDGMGSADWLLLEEQRTPELGDELGLLAYPLGQTLGQGVSYSQGIVNGLRSRNNTSFLQIDTGAAPGSSGGPIFRRDTGHVIGMLHGGLSLESGMIINLGIDMRNFWTLGWTRRSPQP